MKNEPIEFLPVKKFWMDVPSRRHRRGDFLLLAFCGGFAFCGLVLIVIGWLTNK